MHLQGEPDIETINEWIVAQWRQDMYMHNLLPFFVFAAVTLLFILLTFRAKHPRYILRSSFFTARYDTLIIIGLSIMFLCLYAYGYDDLRIIDLVKKDNAYFTVVYTMLAITICLTCMLYGEYRVHGEGFYENGMVIRTSFYRYANIVNMDIMYEGKRPYLLVVVLRIRLWSFRLPLGVDDVPSVLLEIEKSRAKWHKDS